MASRPIRRILFGTLRSVGGHPSRPAVARRLQRPTRGRSGGTTLPLLGLAPDGVYRAIRVAPDAGALLPHRFTLTCAADIPLQVGRRHRRSALCCTFLRVTPTGRYPASCPAESGRSSDGSPLRRAGPHAATRPTRHRSPFNHSSTAGRPPLRPVPPPARRARRAAVGGSSRAGATRSPRPSRGTTPRC